MPPKAEFERKIREIYAEAQERLERGKTLTAGDNVPRQNKYFLETDKDDEVELLSSHEAFVLCHGTIIASLAMKTRLATQDGFSAIFPCGELYRFGVVLG